MINKRITTETLTTIKSFVTDDGIIVAAITTDQMREVDRIAIEETGPNLFQMMENAGRSLALCAIEMLGQQWRTSKIVVLAGTGGNGGGGICAARHLANHGANVRLCIANPDRLGEVPSFQRKIFRSTSGKEVVLADLDNEHTDLILDAIIGYSLQSTPHGAASEFIQWANQSNVPVLALDVPSGIDATSGRDYGSYVHPTRTMTLALPKTGLHSDKTGKLFLADIGIPQEAYERIGLKFSSPFDERYVVPIRPAEA